MNIKSKQIYIQNFWYVNNYGACLTAYALYTILSEIGHNVKLIDVSNMGEKLSYIFSSFIQKNCKTTKHIKTYSDLESIINSNAVYITGSDQVFRPYLVKDKLSKFLFDYVPCEKKIAMSASFGVYKEQLIKETSQDTIEKMQNSLKSFDKISLREKEGIEICNDIFGVNAEWIIDPVFILHKSYFEELTTKGKQRNANYIASCIFEKKNNKIDKFLQKKYNCNVIELHQSNFSIEDWLKTIKNCKFLITNSYHAMCFAIIFNKPFIALSKDMGASSRFDSIFELLGIENQSITSINDIYTKNCVFNIDYEKVNQRIEEERQKGLAFLQKALESPVGKFEEKQAVRTQYLEETVCKLEQQANLKYQIKKELWNLWLIIFHKYLPEPVKFIIKTLRGNRV